MLITIKIMKRGRDVELSKVEYSKEKYQKYFFSGRES